MRTIASSLLIAVLALLLVSCDESDTDDPKQVVISLFGAMEKNDQAALTHILDLAELMKNTETDYAIQTDNPRMWTSPQQILDDLTGEGATKKAWFRLQRIVNKAKIMGETATVKVTFVDKEASKGYTPTFGLHRVHGTWKIYSFQLYK
ncbi:MAG: hypothetical protein DRP45_12390 [Candidatus Zixiibacteriota bacterium]|nr:MAG: hypothetical protein DRP45_12390 [candidate division Zixibacteria bacterium]